MVAITATTYLVGNVVAAPQPAEGLDVPAVADLAPLIPATVHEPALDRLVGACHWPVAIDLGPLGGGDELRLVDLTSSLCGIPGLG
ncbi:MAG: hypothetical protein AAFZ07_26865 [Actinomycetota bacterium]